MELAGTKELKNVTREHHMFIPFIYEYKWSMEL